MQCDLVKMATVSAQTCLLPSGLQGEAAIANEEREVATGGSKGEAEGQGGEGGQGEAGQQGLPASLPAV